jgi:hypothetical protein
MERGSKKVFGQVMAGKNVISGSGATRALSANESGSIALFDRAAGIVYTLPAARVGTVFEFMVTTTITSNAAKIITAAGTELLEGALVSVDTDTSNATVGFVANGSTHVAISMNGTTTGAIKGTVIRVRCVSATRWVVDGTLLGSGTVATPFATS